MSSKIQLPELPLMLAGVPRRVADLLRAAGVPAEPLPRVTLLASGSGRFVLFDSLSSVSAGKAQRALRQGLTPIDVRKLTDPADWPKLAAFPADSGPSSAPRQFLERLKEELERLGGLWIRLADYPFPYQSAIALAVEHTNDDCRDFGSIVDSLPATATHFVSSLIRGRDLLPLVQPTPVDLGWRIEPADCEPTQRKTLSHWETRLERFRAVRLDPRGLLVTRTGLSLPASRSLSGLGFQYECHPSAGTVCQLDHFGRNERAVPWMQFGTAPLPANAQVTDWVGEHHQSGYPLFLTATADRLHPVQELLGLVSTEPRFSLMWQPSLGEFARWWQLRGRMRLQVWRRDAGYEIHADGDFDSAAWSIEIWRGDHVAAVPLRTSELHVADNGLVYTRVPKKTPAGCTAPHENVLTTLLSPEANQHLAA